MLKDNLSFQLFLMLHIIQWGKLSFHIMFHACRHLKFQSETTSSWSFQEKIFVSAFKKKKNENHNVGQKH